MSELPAELSDLLQRRLSLQWQTEANIKELAARICRRITTTESADNPVDAVVTEYMMQLWNVVANLKGSSETTRDAT